MKTRFDLEQEILEVWRVTDDIKLLYETVMEREVPLTQDQMANILLGLEQLYNLKFERLFNTFEELLRGNNENPF